MRKIIRLPLNGLRKPLNAMNDATAWYNLAIMYHYGEGRPVDLRQALDLYRKVQSSGTRDVSQEIREIEDLL